MITGAQSRRCSESQLNINSMYCISREWQAFGHSHVVQPSKFVLIRLIYCFETTSEAERINPMFLISSDGGGLNSSDMPTEGKCAGLNTRRRNTSAFFKLRKEASRAINVFGGPRRPAYRDVQMFSSSLLNKTSKVCEPG